MKVIKKHKKANTSALKQECKRWKNEIKDYLRVKQGLEKDRVAINKMLVDGEKRCNRFIAQVEKKITKLNAAIKEDNNGH